MSEDVSIEDFKSNIDDLGGFESIKFAPHMRFRAGQRRLEWNEIKDSIESGKIEDVEINHNPNQSIPYEEAYIIFLSVDENRIIVPLYILKDGTMKALTVMRE